jgi:hypothetical protein
MRHIRDVGVLGEKTQCFESQDKGFVLGGVVVVCSRQQPREAVVNEALVNQGTLVEGAELFHYLPSLLIKRVGSEPDDHLR